MGVVPQINERSAIAVEVATRFFLLGVFQFREMSIFAYGIGGRIVEGDFLPLTAGRTLAFCQCHGGMFGRNRWVKVFEEEDTVKKKRNEKAFYASDVKGISLSTDDINDDVKGCNGSAIKIGIVLIKQKLCFKITAKPGNSKRQHYSWKERK